MKHINKFILLSGLIAIFNTAAKADTFQSFLSDAVNDIKVITQAGACNANPYLLKPVGNSYAQAVAPCAAVAANCPAGATATPGISRCQRTASATTDPTILALLQGVYPNYGTSLSVNFPTTALKHDLTNPKAPTGLQCNVDSGNGSQYGTSTGYTPYCFLDLSKIQKLAAGAQRYYQPYYPQINGSVATLWGKNGNNVYISLKDLNNKANYICYPVNYTANARCITLPAGFLNKLGVN